MTLCIAWRAKNNIHLASDSRITLAENSTTDVGIKVISFPVAIYPPMDEAKPLKSRKPAYDKTFGMCVAGQDVTSSCKPQQSKANIGTHRNNHKNPLHSDWGIESGPVKI